MPVVVFKHKVVCKLLLSEYWMLICLFVEHFCSINCLPSIVLSEKLVFVILMEYKYNWSISTIICYLHLPEVKTEVQRGQGTCTRSHSQLSTGAGVHFRHFGSRTPVFFTSLLSCLSVIKTTTSTCCVSETLSPRLFLLLLPCCLCSVSWVEESCKGAFLSSFCPLDEPQNSHFISPFPLFAA